jgi:hypothetical protein
MRIFFPKKSDSFEPANSASMLTTRPPKLLIVRDSRRAPEMEHLSLWELCKANLEGASFAWNPAGHERKALGIGICHHWGSVEQPGVGSSTGGILRDG